MINHMIWDGDSIPTQLALYSPASFFSSQASFLLYPVTTNTINLKAAYLELPQRTPSGVTIGYEAEDTYLWFNDFVLENFQDFCLENW